MKPKLILNVLHRIAIDLGAVLRVWSCQDIVCGLMENLRKSDRVG